MVKGTIQKISNAIKSRAIRKGLKHGVHNVTKVIKDEKDKKVAVVCDGCSARLTQHPVVDFRVQWSKVAIITNIAPTKK